MTTPNPTVLTKITDLAENLEITPQRLRQVLAERGIPRPAHGMIDRGVGLRAYLDSLIEGMAKQWVAKLVDDPVFQGVFAAALVRHWRGLDP